MKPVVIIFLILLSCVFLVLRAHHSDDVTADVKTIRDSNTHATSKSPDQKIGKLEPADTDSSTANVIPTDLRNGDPTDAIIIGSYADPYDTGPLDRRDRDSISIGIILDAGNDEGWPSRENVTAISNGNVLDASDLGYENSPTKKEPIFIGEPLDVERFLAGEYDNASSQDRTPISIGDKVEVPK